MATNKKQQLAAALTKQEHDKLLKKAIEMVDLTPEFSLIVTENQVFLVHKHGIAHKISGSPAVNGCACPVPPEIKILVSLYSFKHNKSLVLHTI